MYRLIREANQVLNNLPESHHNSKAAQALRAALRRLDDLSTVFVDKYSRFVAAEAVRAALPAVARLVRKPVNTAQQVRVFA